MKKKLLALLLLVPILLIPIISCEDGALDGLSEFMGSFGKNSLVEAGAIVIDTSHGGEATKKMSGLAEAEDEEAYSAAVEEIKDVVKEALTSKGSTKAKAFVEDMKKPLAEDAEVPQKVEDAVEELETQLVLDFEIETEGDLLAAVLLVDLMEKAKDDWDDATDEEIMEFVGEALQVIDIVQTVSPVNGVKIDDILGELLGGDLSELFRSRKGSSRDGDAEEEIDKALGIIKPILDPVIRAIGKDEHGKISQNGLNKMIFNFKIIRQSFDDMANALKGVNPQTSDVELSLTDFVNYMLSVVFTEANGVIKLMTDEATFADLINVYIDWADGKDFDFEDYADLFGGGDDEEGATLVEAILDKALATLEILVPFSNDQWILELLQNLDDDNDDN